MISSTVKAWEQLLLSQMMGSHRLKEKRGYGLRDTGYSLTVMPKTDKNTIFLCFTVEIVKKIC